MIDRPAVHDLPRIMLMVLAIGVLIGASVWVMLPFIAAAVWAAMIVVATWPLLLWTQARFGGRRGPAVAAMLLVLIGLLVLPVVLGISAIVDNADKVVDLVKSLVKDGLPQPPGWVEGIPLAGPRLAEEWRKLTGGEDPIAAHVVPHLAGAGRWVLGKAGGLGTVVVQVILTVVICGVLYVTGEKAALGARRFLRRLAGVRGESAGLLAAKAARAVAMGIVVTALAQTVVSGLGLMLAGVPGAGALTAVAFVLCIAQVGPLFVVAPATIWLYASGSPGRGTVMLVFALASVTLDNFVRPILIKSGADLPLLLIIAGVVGGLLAFGVIGIFVGPVVLAVTWTLVASWVDEMDVATTEPSGAKS